MFANNSNNNINRSIYGVFYCLP